METKKISEYNKQALKDNYILFSDSERNPVIKTLTFSSYVELSSKISALLWAIESIGNNTDTDNIVTCSNLAELCRNLLPDREFEFLDDLLIKDNENKEQFIKI